jgi:hypothetical protein
VRTGHRQSHQLRDLFSTFIIGALSHPDLQP